MQTPVPTSLTFYPAYCFSLSPTPTYNTWARLTVAEVHALKQRAGFEEQNLYFHLNHPIRWIRLVGVIVAFDVFPTRWIMLLDDSSGALIEVTCGRPAPTVKAADPVDDFSNEIIEPDIPLAGVTATGRTIDLHGVDIGTFVKVKGGIGSWKGEKQMHLERISIIRTTNEEASLCLGRKKLPFANPSSITLGLQTPIRGCLFFCQDTLQSNIHCHAHHAAGEYDTEQDLKSRESNVTAQSRSQVLVESPFGRKVSEASKELLKAINVESQKDIQWYFEDYVVSETFARVRAQAIQGKLRKQGQQLLRHYLQPEIYLDNEHPTEFHLEVRNGHSNAPVAHALHQFS
ncbi:hypothetical protein JMJ35_006514 [Cladonia borealis]|uniref:CST complex subunit Stn1 N-terminal domain-containing protein n=1 Tax=Cladonia borealis TaxID=184061 RepID=A0AA39QXB4_9LECA|nr:hypothetical protein JMJ35_006514 [Cladonia borealis]